MTGNPRHPPPSHAVPQRSVRSFRTTAWLSAALLGLLLTAPAAAQEGAVSGSVFDEQSLQPLSGAQVSVEGTDIGTLTDAEGRFVLEGVPSPQVTLRVRLIGYRPVTRTVSTGERDVRIGLSVAAVALDEIVVTGTAGAVQRRSLGNSVGTINADEVTDRAPVGSFQELVNARAPGVVIMPGSGQVGTGSKIRIRGVSSLSLPTEPLMYVDGVRVNNSQGTGPITQGFGSRAISRWNDFDPEQIESIEIIRGPAAATLYGTEAANGVVQIITKKGAEGGTQVRATVRQGANWFNNPEGRLWENYGVDPETGQVTTINVVALENERARQGETDFFGNPIQPLFQTGHAQDYSLDVRGGSADLQYYLSGGWKRQEGAEPNNVLEQWNARANLSVTPIENLEVQASVGYVDGRTDLSWESGAGGITWTTFFATPENLGTPRRGFWSGTPEAYYAHAEDWQDLNRFTGSLQALHRPTDWLTHRLTVGSDLTLERNVELVERNEDLEFFFGAETRGYKDVEEAAVTYSTVDYSATATLDLREGLQSATSVGFQYYNRLSEFVSAFGEDFAAPGLRSIDAAAIRRSSEFFVENSTVGLFVQQQFSLDDRLFLTGAVRADDNSAFGENLDPVVYPKVSASWVASEEPFWNVDFVNSFRLRAAYGQSGQQPETFAALRTFQAVPGPDDASAVTPQAIGNPDLGPERGEEIEVGFDASAWDDRVGLEFTFYHTATRDAILLQEIAPSTGFSGSQFINVGKLRNRGIELLARGTPVETGDLDWELTFSLATNSNEVRDLGERDRVVSSSFIEHRVGHPVGSWFAPRVVSADLDAEGRAVNLMCDGGPENDGQPVPCSEAPAVFLGRTVPKVEGAVSSSLTLWDNLRVYGLVDFKTGHHKLDGNLRVRCLFFNLCRENHFPEEFDPARVAEFQNGFVSELIDEASFARLREVSVSYTLPTRLTSLITASGGSLTVAGRNLALWSDYGGIEPEAMFLSGSRGGSHSMWEQNVLPQLHQVVATLRLNF